MKKTLFLLGIMLAFLSSCNNDEVYDGVTNNTTQQNEKTRWYGTGTAQYDVQERGVADAVKLWNQSTGIYIKFLNTPPNGQMIEKIKEIAKEWEDYAGIKFHYVAANEKADVRIAFNWQGNDWLTWSYTGTDARYVRSQSKPTAFFGGLEYLDDEQFQGDVLRVFGQILGLEYEQRHQDWYSNGYWKNEQQLQSYWEDMIDGIDMDWDELREYVFDPLTDQTAILLQQTKEIDELSIMVWPYYTRKQTTNLIANFKLSYTDKKFIEQLYPKDKSPLPTIQDAWVDAGYLAWNDSTRTALTITTLGKSQTSLPSVSDGNQLTSAYNMFNGASKLKKVPEFDASNITNFENMLYGCSALTEVPKLDTSKGTNFKGMFRGCSYLITIPKIDTSRGTDFSYMFYGCSYLSSIPELNTSLGTDFSYMFYNCSSLTTIPLINTSKGTNFTYTFSGCTNLTSIPLIDTSKGTNFEYMFQSCNRLTTIPQINTSKGTSFTYMFSGCTYLTTIPLINTSNGSNMSYMFNSCTSLTSIPELNTSNATNFQYMFYNCQSLTTIPLINTSNGTNMSYMFQGCSLLTNIPLLDTSRNTTFRNTFYGCSSLTTIPLIDTSKATIFWSMFQYCTKLTSIPDIDTSKGNDFDAMFYNCSSLTSKPNISVSGRKSNMYYGTPFA